MNSTIMKKNLAPFVLLLAVVAMFSFTSVKQNTTTSTSSKIGLEIGDEAPNIVMKGVDGKDMKLSSLRGKLVLIDFWASWCGPCRMIAPVLDKIADANIGKAVVAKVNVDEAPGVASRFRVSSIPTLLFFKNGEVNGQIVGLQSEADLTAKLTALM
jgi:thioredoxin 1